MNLSDHILTESELAVLSKGLNFIPCFNTKDYTSALTQDLKLFHRRLLLNKYFEDEGDGNRELFVYPNREWTPNHNILDSSINKGFKQCYEHLRHHQTFPCYHNITIEERQALKSLRSNRDIVINVADKGSNVVIQNTSDYKTEIYRQLHCSHHYLRITEPIYPTTAIKLTKILSRLKRSGFITPKQCTYLTPPPDPRPRRIYTLPKIHKPPNEWFFPSKIPPGRPIVSDIDSESYHIAEYINHFLQPLASRQASHIKDSFHFLTLLKDCHYVPSHTLLITLDVDSMYTNIDNTQGLRCLRRIFDTHPDPARPDDLLLDLISVSLSGNDFLFDGVYWLQNSGTAMGKIFAPAYANLFMTVIEQDFFLTRSFIPFFYKRYLDDIFMLWNHGLPCLEEFIAAFNGFCPSIKFKQLIDPVSVDFLDVTVFKHSPLAPQTLLCTKVHFKVTNTLQLLHRHSFHPKHTFAGIVRSQIYRYYRLSSNIEDFHSTTSILFKALRRQHYSARFLLLIKERFMRDIASGTLIGSRPKPHVTAQILPLVTTFHLGSNSVVSCFIRELRQLDSPDLAGTRIVTAYRRNKNIADLVVRNKL